MSTQTLLVDCLKIINWLEDRKKLHKDWYNYEKAAEQKIKQILKEQQEYADQEQIYNYLKQNHDTFHYCDIVHVANLLLSTKWAENKSMVFGYSDKRVKQVMNLKKFMENKNVHIVNTAKFISQGLTFDLPSLDKNIQLIDNQITGLKRKIDMNENAIYQQDKQQTNQRIRLNLNPNKQIPIIQQLPILIKQTPTLFNNIHELCIKLKPLLDKYNNFCQTADQTDVQLKALSYFIVNGDQYQVVYNGGVVSEGCVKYREFMEWVPENQWGIQVEDSFKKDKKESAMTILENRKTRLQIIEDLNHLLYFYHGVKYEISMKVSGFTSESSLNMVEGDAIEAITLIDNILSILTKKIVSRIQIKNNPKVLQVMLKKFRSYGQNIEQMKRQNKQFDIQIQQLKTKRQQMALQLRRLRHKLVQSKNSCQKYLSEYIKREIRIKGEINKLQ